MFFRFHVDTPLQFTGDGLKFAVLRYLYYKKKTGVNKGAGADKYLSGLCGASTGPGTADAERIS
jgi:hypothetical protein